jgi:hypothetical protein
MNPSQLLRKFLSTGTKPASVRDQSALLDEARSHLVSKLPTTAETIQNFSEAEIESITAGGKPGAMDRAYAIYNEKQGRFVKTGNPLAKPAAKAPKAAPRPAPAPVASKPAPVIHRATAAAKPTTPAPSATVATITAAVYLSRKDTAPRMYASEFEKLDHPDRNSFIREGGKLIADPKPAKN